jgi:hypothetical protein
VISRVGLVVRGSLFGALASLATACGSDLANGDDCAGGFGTGDLVITEVMANPGGGVEYVEIFNPSTVAVDLKGLALFAGDRVHELGPVQIAAGRYFTAGAVADAERPDHISYGYADDLALDDGGGRIGMRCQGVLVDDMEYPAASAGVALEVDGRATPEAFHNDQTGLLCESTHEFEPGGFGTPRESNRFCTIIAPTTCNGVAGERPINVPATGALVISEVMADPEAVEDVDGQWFELIALADFDLNGLHAGTEVGSPRVQVGAADCVAITAGQHLLFARSADEVANGGLPAADALFPFKLPATGGSLAIGVGAETVDQITWEAAVPGASMSLGIRNNDPVVNDQAAAFCPGTVAYNGTDLGTPAAVNDFCVLATECLDGTTMAPRDRLSPGAGEIRIVEWMANPDAAAGDDNGGEYIEVRLDVAADLNGLQIGRDTGVVTSEIESRDCLPAAAGSVVLFVRDLDPSQNGGIDVANEVMGFGLLNGGDRIFAGVQGLELDVVADTGNANADTGPGDEGVSAQIDRNGVLCDTPLGNTYGDGDRGTPGVVNPDC